MRILQIIPHYIPAHSFGGPLRVAHFLGIALQHQGHHVTTVTTNLADKNTDLDVALDEPVDVDGITVYYEPTSFYRYWGFSPGLFRRASKEVQRADITIVHAHYQFANWAGAWIARRAKKPYIIFPHGSLHRQGIGHKNTLFKIIYLCILERRNLLKALFIAFNAQEEKISSFYSEKGNVVPNGIDPNEFSVMPPAGLFRSRYKEVQGKTVFLFLGRLDIKHKGLDLLIPAFAKLIKKHPEAHLVLAGPNEDDGALSVHKIVRQHCIEKNVTFTGLIHGQIKLAALHDADVFVLPSRFEGLSISLLEALYVGLPMLVTDQVGLSGDIMSSKAGLVIPAKSGEAIYEGLLRLIDTKFRAKMRGRGTELVLRNHTWDAIATNLICKIQELS